MLGKLLKYDLKSMFRTLVLIWAASLILAVINHFTLDGVNFSGTMTFIGQVIPMFLYVISMLAMAILTLIFVISRFYNGLLSDEGYLMFTLPVKPWHLITSKGISAVIVIALSILVAIASVTIIVPFSNVKWFFEALAKSIMKYTDITNWQLITLYIELFLLFIITLAKSVYQIYASISLGHLFNKHRKIMAFVMFIAISVILSIITYLFSNVIFSIDAYSLPNIYARYLSQNSAFANMNIIIVSMLVLSVIQLIIFHVITERILNKHLNLE